MRWSAAAALLAVLSCVHPAWAQPAGTHARMLRWSEPAGEDVDYFEARWRTAGEVPSAWEQVLGATEFAGVWYGVAFVPATPVEVEVRAVSVDGMVSDPSNARPYPSCDDADLNRDGVVGGPDFTSWISFYGQVCPEI